MLLVSAACSSFAIVHTSLVSLAQEQPTTTGAHAAYAGLPSARQRDVLGTLLTLSVEAEDVVRHARDELTGLPIINYKAYREACNRRRLFEGTTRARVNN